MADNRVRILATLDDKVSGNLNKIRDRFDTMGKSKGFQSIVSGVGLGIGVAAWTAASSKIVDVLGDSIAAAREEEVSIQKLGTALKANIPNWDGNTAAIEKTLKARMALGFADDEQRDSLAQLVAATNDVNEALAIQSTAMDLARFKGISLADATTALIKVEAGSYRILKSLGIELPKNASRTEALAAVQKVAAKQAEDYAKTNEGKLLVSQVKVGEAMETLGGVLLPVVVNATEAAADAATTLADAYDYLSGKTELTTDEQIDLAESLLRMAGNAPLFGEAFTIMADQVEAGQKQITESVDTSVDHVEDMRGAFTMDGSAIISSLGKMGDASEDWRDKFRDTSGAVIRSSNKVRDAFADNYQDMVDQYFDPLELRADLFDQQQALHAANEAARNAKKGTQARQAADDVIAAIDDEATTLGELGRKQALTAKDVDKFEADVKASYKALGIKVPEEVNKMIARLRAFTKFDGTNINLGVIFDFINKADRETRGLAGPRSSKGKKNPLIFAEGGVVPGYKGEPQLAIVHGGETVIPTGQAGYEGLALAGGGAPSSTVVHTHIYLDGRQIAKVVDEHNYFDLRRAVPTRGR